MFTADKQLIQLLKRREEQRSLRSLSLAENLIDFSSNDYLGLAREASLSKNEKGFIYDLNGSTGSRLLTGNSSFAEYLEEYLATHYKAESALLFNSGYDANIGLLSSVPQRNDTIIYDELIHASVRDGIRLSHARSFSFKHNDLSSLKDKLKASAGTVYVAVESVYSMDGDFAPLKELTELAVEHNFNLIVDEAHATGVFGEKGEGRIVELNLQNKIFAKVNTFGKAVGCHGAVVTGSNLLKKYLVNFARSFIYTTALPPHTLNTIYQSHLYLSENPHLITELKDLITHFKRQSATIKGFIASESSVQSIIIEGNEKVKAVSASLRTQGFDIRPILSPTVPKGKERLRICLHHYNSKEQVDQLLQIIRKEI